MDEGQSMAVMQGVTMYMALLASMVVGGVAYWFRYRVFGVGLIVVSAALLLWLAAGAPM
ncbi:MAG TPA: hypothetical protein VLV76_26595 [Candidatus Acidoferrum sp.]|nr:hypothetical protein [Candidatus Acidoferrum sp.]